MNDKDYTIVFRAMVKAHLETSIELGKTDKKHGDLDYQLKRFLAWVDVKSIHELMVKDMIEMALDGDFPDWSGDLSNGEIREHIGDLNGEWDLDEVHKALHEYFGLPEFVM